ncbi:hypothetical protein TNCV_2510521 [Trichonephila clavipes]|nr:hypothetical protein TNCV_2510521 [Trichonephila clavipes]
MEPYRVSRVDEAQAPCRCLSKTVEPSKLCGLEHCRESASRLFRFLRNLVNGLSSILINCTSYLGNVFIVSSCRMSP